MQSEGEERGSKQKIRKKAPGVQVRSHVEAASNGVFQRGGNVRRAIKSNTQKLVRERES